MKVLVIGASTKPYRMSNLVIRQLESDYEVLAIGRAKGKIGDLLISQEMVNFSDIHTVTLYINPDIQPKYYKYITSLKPKRVIFNPGTENEAFRSHLIAKNIRAENACTLVMLRSGQF